MVFSFFSSQLMSKSSFKNKNLNLTPEKIQDIDRLCLGIFEDLSTVLPSESLSTISLLCPIKPVLDDVTKLVVKDSENRPSAVILCSPPSFPQIVETYIERTKQAQLALSPTFCHTVITPIYQGELSGRTYAVLPYHKPLEQGRLRWYWQRFKLSSEMFNLLHEITEITCTKISDDQVNRNFIQPLRHLINLEALPKKYRDLAQEALDSSVTGAWQPRHILMHNDFWKGNVLLSRNNSDVPKTWKNRFVLIDWSGSTVQGYGIYDLVRLAESMKLKPSLLRVQLDAHCQILDCSMEQAKYHLITALAYLALHLENFPMDRFLVMAKKCVDTFEVAQQK